MNLRETIMGIKENTKNLNKVSLKDLIEASTDKRVIKFDNKIKEHKEILKDIITLGTLIKNKYERNLITREEYEERRGRKVNAFRNNEIGEYAEILMEDHFYNNKSQFAIITNLERLPAKGYPDMKMTIKNNGFVFLEIKATSRPDQGSPRDFYYKPGGNSDKKINCDAMHLLFGFITKQVQNGFIITGFKIVDVSRMFVKLKPEFNTDNKGIYTHYTTLFPKQKNLIDY